MCLDLNDVPCGLIILAAFGGSYAPGVMYVYHKHYVGTQCTHIPYVVLQGTALEQGKATVSK